MIFLYIFLFPHFPTFLGNGETFPPIDLGIFHRSIIKVFPQLSFNVANDLLPILPWLIENLVYNNEITKDSIAEICIIMMHNLLIMGEGPNVPNIHDCMHSLISLSFDIYFKEASAASKFAIVCLTITHVWSCVC